MHLRISAHLHMNTWYTCHRCGVGAAGTRHSLEGLYATSVELKAAIDAIPAKPENMPVGWGSYHDDDMRIVFRCSECIYEGNHK